MGLSGIGADDKKTMGFLDVGIAADRLIGAKRGEIAAHGAGHAQPGVALDIIGLQAAAHNLLENIGLLGQGLAGTVIGDRFATPALCAFGEIGRRRYPGPYPRRSL